LTGFFVLGHWFPRGIGADRRLLKASHVDWLFLFYVIGSSDASEPIGGSENQTLTLKNVSVFFLVHTICIQIRLFLFKI